MSNMNKQVDDVINTLNTMTAKERELYINALLKVLVDKGLEIPVPEPEFKNYDLLLDDTTIKFGYSKASKVIMEKYEHTREFANRINLTMAAYEENLSKNPDKTAKQVADSSQNLMIHIKKQMRANGINDTDPIYKMITRGAELFRQRNKLSKEKLELDARDRGPSYVPVEWIRKLAKELTYESDFETMMVVAALLSGFRLSEILSEVTMFPNGRDKHSCIFYGMQKEGRSEDRVDLYKEQPEFDIKTLKDRLYIRMLLCPFSDMQKLWQLIRLKMQTMKASTQYSSMVNKFFDRNETLKALEEAWLSEINKVPEKKQQSYIKTHPLPYVDKKATKVRNAAFESDDDDEELIEAPEVEEKEMKLDVVFHNTRSWYASYIYLREKVMHDDDTLEQTFKSRALNHKPNSEATIHYMFNHVFSGENDYSNVELNLTLPETVPQVFREAFSKCDYSKIDIENGYGNISSNLVGHDNLMVLAVNWNKICIPRNIYKTIVEYITDKTQRKRIIERTEAFADPYIVGLKKKIKNDVVVKKEKKDAEQITTPVVEDKRVDEEVKPRGRYTRKGKTAAE